MRVGCTKQPRIYRPARWINLKKNSPILLAFLQIWEYWWEKLGFCWLTRISSFRGMECGLGRGQATIIPPLHWTSSSLFWWIEQSLPVVAMRMPHPQISNCRDRSLQSLGSEIHHGVCTKAMFSVGCSQAPAEEMSILTDTLGSKALPWSCPTFLALHGL